MCVRVQPARRWLWAVPLGFAAAVGPAASGDILRVDSTVAASGDGSLWPLAFKTLQEALDRAMITQGSDEIWVAVGELDAGGNPVGYRPTKVGGGVPGLAFRRVTFELQEGVGIYGGFLGNAPGGGEALRPQRDPENEDNETVLSGVLPDVCSPGCNPGHSCFATGPPGCDCSFCCDAVCADLPFCCFDEWDDDCVEAAFDRCPTFLNAFHVVTGTDLDQTAILDGFTVTQGVADGNHFFACPDADNDGDCDDPQFSSYHFQGGGIILSAGRINTDQLGPVIARSRLVGNLASEGGGLASNGGDTFALKPTLASLDFRENSAAGDGGGAWSGPTSRELWVNALFACNTASQDGAGLFMLTGTELNLTNSTFTDNSAEGVAGGLRLEETDDLVQTQLANCIFWNNTDGPGGTLADAQATVVPAGELDVTQKHSDVQGGPLIANVINGGGNIAADPMFVDPVGPDPVSCLDNNYRLPDDSPCVDTGDNASVPADAADLDEDGNFQESTPADLDHKLRIEVIVDMGAYEFLLPGCPWDCAGDDGEVGINDFLALLAQWGTAGSCDIDGDGTVGIVDFLSLLGHWGPCPLFGQNPPQSLQDCIDRFGMEDPVVLEQCICKVEPQECP